MPTDDLIYVRVLKPIENCVVNYPRLEAGVVLQVPRNWAGPRIDVGIFEPVAEGEALEAATMKSAPRRRG
jgi:hypothetical protein